jgi:hypothetical protein
MIGVTISGKAYAAIADALPGGSAQQGPGVVPDGEYYVWLPKDVVVQLIALREPGETFSDAILRLNRSIVAIIRGSAAQH